MDDKRKQRGVSLRDSLWNRVTSEAKRRSQGPIRISATGMVEIALVELLRRLDSGEAVEGLPDAEGPS